MFNLVMDLHALAEISPLCLWQLKSEDTKCHSSRSWSYTSSNKTAPLCQAVERLGRRWPDFSILVHVPVYLQCLAMHHVRDVLDAHGPQQRDPFSAQKWVFVWGHKTSRNLGNPMLWTHPHLVPWEVIIQALAICQAWCHWVENESLMPRDPLTPDTVQCPRLSLSALASPWMLEFLKLEDYTPSFHLFSLQDRMCSQAHSNAHHQTNMIVSFYPKMISLGCDPRVITNLASFFFPVLLRYIGSISCIYLR